MRLSLEVSTDQGWLGVDVVVGGDGSSCWAMIAGNGLADRLCDGLSLLSSWDARL